MSTMKRLRGLRTLVGDVVEHGSKAVQEVHIATTNRTFVVLEAIPPIAGPAKIVHAVYDATTTTVHVSIRTINGVIATTLDAVLEISERPREP